MRKLIALIIAVVAVLSLATTAFAATQDAPPFGPRFGGGFGCNSLALDENGEFVSRDVFEANLDKAIEDATISAEYRDFILERFDYRIANGGTTFGRGYGRFGGPGFGRGFAAPNN